jgi:hypothetical protein
MNKKGERKEKNGIMPSQKIADPCLRRVFIYFQNAYSKTDKTQDAAAE